MWVFMLSISFLNLHSLEMNSLFFLLNRSYVTLSNFFRERSTHSFIEASSLIL